MPEKKNLSFIVNPVSGIGKQKHFEQFLASKVDTSVYDIMVYKTRSRGHATEISRELCQRDKNQTIIAVGGDGTVNEVLQGIGQSEIPVGIIPSGSGNGLALHLKLPLNINKALQIILSGKTQRIDAGYINDKLFVSTAGIGFDARVARKYAKIKKRGFWSYLNIMIKEYPKYKEDEYIIETDKKTIKTKALFITAANSDQFGFNTAIAPHASICDGRLDLCIMKKVPVIEVAIVAQMLFFKMIDQTKYMEIHRVKEAKIRRNSGKGANVDGEYLKMGKIIHFELRPAQFNILVP